LKSLAHLDAYEMLTFALIQSQQCFHDRCDRQVSSRVGREVANGPLTIVGARSAADSAVCAQAPPDAAGLFRRAKLP
jgi:hypothetical protein